MKKLDSYIGGLIRSVTVMSIAFLPFAIDWTYKVFIHPRPYWILFYDPELVYFYDGLALSEGRLPFRTIPHPGVPINLVSSTLLRLTDYGPFEIDNFRVLGYIVSLIFIIAMAFFLLRTLFRNLPIMIQVAGLLTYFIHPHALLYNNIYSPEMFYFPAASLLLIALWGGDWDEFSYKRTSLIGLATGLCCAIKFTFLPFAFALVISLLLTPHANFLEKAKVASIGLIGTSLGFFVATLIEAPLYPKMFRWLWLFTIHKGPYLSGPVGIPDLAIISKNIYKAMFRGKVWNVWIVMCSAVFLVCLLREYSSKRHLSRRLIFLTSFGFVALLASYVLAIPKASMGLRYLLPTAIVAVLFYALSMRLAPSKWIFKLQIPILILVLLLMTKNIGMDLNHHRRIIREGHEINHKIADSIKDLKSTEFATVIYSWRVPQPSYALRYMADERHLHLIEEKYPNEGHYDPWTHKVSLPSSATSWDYLVIRESNISEFPEPLGPILASLGRYRIVGAPQSR